MSKAEIREMPLLECGGISVMGILFQFNGGYLHLGVGSLTLDSIHREWAFPWVRVEERGSSFVGLVFLKASFFSLCRSGWPETGLVDQSILKLRSTCLSFSDVLPHAVNSILTIKFQLLWCLPSQHFPSGLDADHGSYPQAGVCSAS